MARRFIIVMTAALLLAGRQSASGQYKVMPDPVMGQQLMMMFTGAGALGAGNFMAQVEYDVTHKGYKAFAYSGVTGATLQRSMTLIPISKQPQMAENIDSAYVKRELIDGEMGVVGMERVIDASGDYSRLSAELSRMQDLIDNIRPCGGTEDEHGYWQEKHDDYESAAGSLHGTGFSSDKILPNQMRKMGYGGLYHDVRKDCSKLVRNLLYWKYRRDVSQVNEQKLGYRLTGAAKKAAGLTAFVKWLDKAKNVKVGAGQQAQQQ